MEIDYCFTDEVYQIDGKEIEDVANAPAFSNQPIQEIAEKPIMVLERRHPTDTQVFRQIIDRSFPSTEVNEKSSPLQR